MLAFHFKPLWEIVKLFKSLKVEFLHVKDMGNELR
jgi:hypothetical protein